MTTHRHAHLPLKLGKAPARPDAIKLKFSDYLLKAKLPTVPAEFGHEATVPVAKLGMLGNDNYGDCVWAGGDHEHILWNAAAGASVSFGDGTKTALADYASCTGFKPSDPNTDQGTDMEVAAKYRLKTGLVDAAGKRHKILGYLDLTPGDLNQHLMAAYLFGSVGIGIEFPGSAMDQFNAGKPWDVVSHAKVEGGHYIPFVGRHGGMTNVVTWGAYQKMTDKFFAKYNDESIVYLTSENIKGGKSPEGFDLATLQADMKSLTGYTVGHAH